MPTATVNGVRLFYEMNGTAGVPLVLVHGSWDSHETWNGIVPRLAESFHVVTYDRRGHSDSERPAGQGSIHEDAADLAALIGYLGFAPAWIVGNSFGASILLRLAGQRADLFRGLSDMSRRYSHCSAAIPNFNHSWINWINGSVLWLS